MALNKQGIDLKAIRKDQKAIDSLPNKGRASVNHAKSKALKAKKSWRQREKENRMPPTEGGYKAPKGEKKRYWYK